jgi:LacI family transcriptional regulator
MEGWLEKGKASRNVDYVQCDGYDEVAGYERMKQHVLRYGPPTGVFATGDLLAIGAMRALRELGRDPGRDTHVVGATGLQLAAYAHPPLTVVQSPMEQMGQNAAQMLLTMAREGVRRMIGRYVGTKMVVRESCRIPEMMLDEERRAIADAT